jgi:hypothetical protein
MIRRNLAQWPGNGRRQRRSDRMGGLLRRGLLGLGMLVGALMLTACYPPVLPQKISEVRPAETTYDQVVATFGLPSSEAMLTGGSKIVMYNVPEYDRGLFQSMPFLNLFKSQYDGSAYDYFIFNREGVLQSFSIPHFARLAGVDDPGS